ncbi:MAG TPA: polyprenyl synthetase family protein [Terriglobales bacterium]|nr:polyprenyl synthetase family protein [Terriglobales bacterium]
MSDAAPASSAPAGAVPRPSPFDLVRDALRRVEAQFLEDTVSTVSGITEIGQYLHAGGGKRVRPALVLLAAALCGVEGPGVIALATVVEMIHAATLIHDDVIDGAETRRGRPSTNFRWGTQKCVLAGDWLYMQAFKVALQLRHFGILDELITLTQAMVEGELLQQEMTGRVVTREQHLELIERKTARLFSVSCKLAAMLGGLGDDIIARLGAYGHHLGLAFQMVDDLLDLTASAAQLGKPVGNDLREGKMTLACLDAYAAASAEGRAHFECVLRERGYRSVAFDEIQALLAASGALTRARLEARQHAERARELILLFPPSPYRDALEDLPLLMVERAS